MSLEEIVPYLEIIGFIITIIIIVYGFGKWKQKSETDKEEMQKKLNAVSEKIERIPDDLLSKSIDLYRMLEKMQEKPQKTTIKEEKEDE